MKKSYNQLADRIQHLEPEGAYEVLAKAQQLEAEGRDIIHLEIGQPDFQTFPNIGIAGIRAVATGQTRYTPSAGIPELKKEIAAYTTSRVGKSFSADNSMIFLI